MSGSLNGSTLQSLASAYGPTFVGTYAFISLATFLLVFCAISQGVDVNHLMRALPLPSFMTPRETPDESGATQGFRFGSEVLLSIACTKLLVPVKVPIAAALTPRVARWLGTTPLRAQAGAYQRVLDRERVHPSPPTTPPLSP